MRRSAVRAPDRRTAPVAADAFPPVTTTVPAATADHRPGCAGLSQLAVRSRDSRVSPSGARTVSQLTSGQLPRWWRTSAPCASITPHVIGHAHQLIGNLGYMRVELIGPLYQAHGDHFTGHINVGALETLGRERLGPLLTGAHAHRLRASLRNRKYAVPAILQCFRVDEGHKLDLPQYPGVGFPAERTRHTSIRKYLNVDRSAGDTYIGLQRLAARQAETAFGVDLQRAAPHVAGLVSRQLHFDEAGPGDGQIERTCRAVNCALRQIEAQHAGRTRLSGSHRTGPCWHAGATQYRGEIHRLALVRRGIDIGEVVGRCSQPLLLCLQANGRNVEGILHDQISASFSIARPNRPS